MDIQFLVVEDDENICNMVKKFLLRKNYLVDTCSDGNKALEQIYDKHYHLIILDIMLPGISGQEILKELRKIHDTPVLMMTALDDDANQLLAFSNETDDYVTKPFSMPILMKRVEALLRRSGVLKKEIRAGKLTLYPDAYKVDYDGESIQLAPKELDVLLLLAQNKGRVISHEVLLTKIWGYDFAGNEGIVHANIKKLRNKLPVNIIKTIKGVGYCLEENEI
ncbi:response regulator transcription factor [Dictyobacter formicarum]|uniref:Regulatory protein VanRB n=1 Tax=Dictyobacter formicarum TaxID=2778368 RepID=A0ABQ3VUZ0_9CHLR|nr:response regulator transcription factor [Dictyobacter formicarum]GHO89454.1 regulatory protein VanRB [Dictyobacter formicarum]